MGAGLKPESPHGSAAPKSNGATKPVVHASMPPPCRSLTAKPGYSTPPR